MCVGSGTNCLWLTALISFWMFELYCVRYDACMSVYMPYFLGPLSFLVLLMLKYQYNCFTVSYRTVPYSSV